MFSSAAHHQLECAHSCSTFPGNLKRDACFDEVGTSKSDAAAAGKAAFGAIAGDFFLFLSAERS